MDHILAETVVSGIHHQNILKLYKRHGEFTTNSQPHIPCTSASSAGIHNNAVKEDCRSAAYSATVHLSICEIRRAVTPCFEVMKLWQEGLLSCQSMWGKLLFEDGQPKETGDQKSSLDSIEMKRSCPNASGHRSQENHLCRKAESFIARLMMW